MQQRKSNSNLLPVAAIQRIGRRTSARKKVVSDCDTMPRARNSWKLPRANALRGKICRAQTTPISFTSESSCLPRDNFSCRVPDCGNLLMLSATGPSVTCAFRQRWLGKRFKPRRLQTGRNETITTKYERLIASTIYRWIAGHKHESGGRTLKSDFLRMCPLTNMKNDKISSSVIVV